MSSVPNYGRGPLSSLAAIGESTDPRRRMRASMTARVVKYSGGFVDLVPDDPDFPSMPAVPLRHGFPGVVIDTISPGTTVLVGWGGGDPSDPFCALWSGNEGGVSATLNADLLTLGGSDGASPPLKSDPTLNALGTYLDALATATTAALTSLGLSSAASALATAQGVYKAQVPQFSATNVLVK